MQSRKRKADTAHAETCTSQSKGKSTKTQPLTRYANIKEANTLNFEVFQSRFFPLDLPLRKYSISSPDQYFYLSLQSVNSISLPALTECFKLIEKTSGNAYKASQRGWKPRSKWREMKDPDMKYLLVYDQEDYHDRNDDTKVSPASGQRPLLGFLSFMLTTEPPEEVLYVYEIHLCEEMRRKGLGVHLMRAAEFIACQVGVAKSMLTVFTSNERARNFYLQLGYDYDRISPRDRKLRGVVHPTDYTILSKDCKKGRK